VIKALSSNMYLASALLFLVGILYALSLPGPKPSQNFLVLATAFYVALGIYTGLAARSFGAIAASRGQEQNQLKSALNNLSDIYRLVIIYGAIAVVVLAIGLIFRR
jgi:hypothetical protein